MTNYLQRALSYSLLAFLANPLFAQITFKVNSIPANTPAGAPIHIVGSFNNWAPGDATKILTLNNGVYSITFTPPTGTVEYKFTRGSWATVEGNANGTYLPNRTVTYSGTPITHDLSILSWEDLGAGGGGSGTAAANVFLLDDDFYMPELNRNRQIWIYLPPDYNTSSKNYPVLYMHDGQNLFNANTSFSGEWEVDESLNALFSDGDYGCIVVGIYNGGAERLNEYSPWVNPQYGGGQGDEYVDFIVNTLKPYVDIHYRTLPGRQSTGIMGSSMGGLISMYAFSERQDVFSKAGIFSSAFWFADSNSANHTASHPRLGNARVYFLTGGQEPAYVTQDMDEVIDAMGTAGFSDNEHFRKVAADGQHSEWFWAREFPDAYVWLFQDAVSSTAQATTEPLDIFPNPAGDWVRFSGQQDAALHVQLFGADGRLWRDSTLQATQALWTGDLPAGVYLVKAFSPNTGWRQGRVVLH
jgi:predicted alpha/beta superfamily hydrolase